MQLATGLPPLFKSAVPFKGPVIVAIYAFTSILAIAVIGDARAADSARSDPSSTRFEGVWETILSCPNFHGALGYSFKFASTVKASLYADGLVGGADFAVGRRPAGTQYGYHIEALFRPDGAEGHRVEGRPCSVVWARRR